MAGEVPATAAATVTMPPAPELAWSPSTMTDADIEVLVAQGLLQDKAISGWRSCTGEAFPSEDRMETVVFRSFYEKGFGLPLGAFFRGLLHYYGLEATHLKPNSITQIATFIHLCKGLLGIAPHFNMWRALYHLRAYLMWSAAPHSRSTTAGSNRRLSSRTTTKDGRRSGSWW
ncbi:orf3 [Panicum miliaceum]|uniref:Orf3 n=1 Tax=Panicum miliaceum TaxID=4540 RepID=A0A3L6RJP0_PANMI|nr:orf3 [Panicum miliaceum]